MRQVIYYAIAMFIFVVLAPLIIVRYYNTISYDIFPVECKDIKVNVYMHKKNEVVNMSLDEYLKGVVAAEMPAEFEKEALKAQAVASRTYAMGRMRGIYKSKESPHIHADVCTDPAHCQAWVDEDEALKKWDEKKAKKYWKKISSAVDETKNEIILYNDVVINPLFHANSGGKTENIEDVWSGLEVPYLKAVESQGEDGEVGYKDETVMKLSCFIDTIKNKYHDFEACGMGLIDNINITRSNSGNRVKEIKIGNLTLKGTEFRNLFSLKSTKFEIGNNEEGELAITTFGHGHGVGMSQYGANYLAKNGGSYKDILRHYYKGVRLEEVE